MTPGALRIPKSTAMASPIGSGPHDGGVSYDDLKSDAIVSVVS
jgi:hypothetical protein